ncbi:hypothetical protein M407DRAFT_247232 [Tulasnella calospora MUT 4182]|uniref:F-box domain-containing protein n=1 Tax=Tulasnella calospora MUT 4182 TaxID=1051891 RepID=A0A0C3PZS0_9AGAM|nr:hypothetical protein M407DRAFT_247232 [Tulasnella calospora MUT 4182]
MDSPGMEIDDEVISAISSAWPNLVRLKLDGFYDTPEMFARPSLHGLAEILGRCPKLYHLTLEVDASARHLQAEVANASPASSEPHEKLFLNVRTSPIAENSEEAIFKYLMSLWPGEFEVWSTWGEVGWQRATWKKVRELMQQRG